MKKVSYKPESVVLNLNSLNNVQLTLFNYISNLKDNSKNTFISADKFTTTMLKELCDKILISYVEITEIFENNLLVETTQKRIDDVPLQYLELDILHLDYAYLPLPVYSQGETTFAFPKWFYEVIEKPTLLNLEGFEKKNSFNEKAIQEIFSQSSLNDVKFPNSTLIVSTIYSN